MEATRFKKMGVRAGVADLILLVSRKGYNALCLELKTQTGKQSEAQKEWQEAVQNEGSMYVVVLSVEEGINIVNWYLE